VSQANKQLVLEALHALDRGNADAFAELHHPDYVNHEAAAGRQRGPQGARATAAFLHGTFADLRHEPLDAVAEGDLVVIRGQASGRHIAEIDGFPATGRTFSVQHIHIVRVTDGKISEHWACRDDLGAARQLGLVPASGQSGGLRPRRKRWLRRRDADGHRSTATPDADHKPTPIDYAHLVAAAGPWLAWAGIPLVLTQRRRRGDRR
jgi:predicted ester cyclase